MLRVAPAVYRVYTPYRRNDVVHKKEFGRFGEKKKRAKNPPTHRQKKKEELERSVYRNWSGR